MVKQTANYILREFAQRVLGLLLFLLGSWGSFGLREIIYFGTYICIGLVSCMILYVANPDELKAVSASDTELPGWYKKLYIIYMTVGIFVIYLAAGLGYMKMNTDIWYYIGLGIYLWSAFISVWAQAVNKNLGSKGKMQADAEQRICAIGPYKHIRHPFYAAVLMWCYAMCLMFPHLYVAMCAIIAAGIICAITWFEDRMLSERVAGYTEYAETVEYRLIPYLW